jgi:hypothetical protein
MKTSDMGSQHNFCRKANTASSVGISTPQAVPLLRIPLASCTPNPTRFWLLNKGSLCSTCCRQAPVSISEWRPLPKTGEPSSYLSCCFASVALHKCPSSANSAAATHWDASSRTTPAILDFVAVRPCVAVQHHGSWPALMSDRPDAVCASHFIGRRAFKRL